MERILRLAGLPTDKDRDDFVFIVLREQTPDKRKQIIGYMLENMPDVGLLIIDGIRDLMYDINSPSESTDLINLLMRWSSGYNLHIHTVLHLNKGDDNARGHIGTELNNKAETVLTHIRQQEELCMLDNDEAGRKAVEAIRQEYKWRVRDASHLYSGHNDLNDYLRSLKVKQSQDLTVTDKPQPEQDNRQNPGEKRKRGLRM